MSAQPTRLVHILATPQGVTGTLRGQLRYLTKQGFDVYVISSPSKKAAGLAAAEGASYIPVEMRREISPFHDFRALWRLTRVLRRLRPDICQVGMPKAGLLGGIAAWLARVPCRVYLMHGLRLETLHGPKRLVLTWTEYIACATAHRVICVSESLRRQALRLGIADKRRCTVLGAGSANGVDVERFAQSHVKRSAARRLRKDLGIPEDAPVIGFVGRLTRDKGVYELVEAFEDLKRPYPDLHLLLVGPQEDGDPIPYSTRAKIALEPHIVCTGHVDDTSPYYHVMDIVALPSYREGLPMVALEAGAAGKPVVGTKATGMADVIEEGCTGMLTSVGEVAPLVAALEKLLADPVRAHALGEAACNRVTTHFRQEDVWRRLCDLYRLMLPGERSLPDAAEASSRAFAGSSTRN